MWAAGRACGGVGWRRRLVRAGAPSPGRAGTRPGPSCPRSPEHTVRGRGALRAPRPSLCVGSGGRGARLWMERRGFTPSCGLCRPRGSLLSLFPSFVTRKPHPLSGRLGRWEATPGSPGGGSAPALPPPDRLWEPPCHQPEWAQLAGCWRGQRALPAGGGSQKGGGWGMGRRRSSLGAWRLAWDRCAE